MTIAPAIISAIAASSIETQKRAESLIADCRAYVAAEIAEGNAHAIVPTGEVDLVGIPVAEEYAELCRILLEDNGAKALTSRRFRWKADCVEFREHVAERTDLFLCFDRDGVSFPALSFIQANLSPLNEGEIYPYLNLNDASAPVISHYSREDFTDSCASQYEDEISEVL
jgi:hypothetical protein